MEIHFREAWIFIPSILCIQTRRKVRIPRALFRFSRPKLKWREDADGAFDLLGIAALSQADDDA
jgi:hypothetical protein